MSFRPPTAQQLSINGPAGLLEAVLEEPVASPAAAFAILCHPHPLHGGTLHNKVVHTLARTFQERGLPSVRFNYRGVGASAGQYDGGRGEVDDALAVIAWGRQRWPDLRLVLAGFSFGALVALRAAATTATLRLISVAPAVSNAEFAAISRPACPWLIVQGDADEIVDYREVQAFTHRFSPPPQLQLLPGATHFFHGKLEQLRAVVGAFMDHADGPAAPAAG